MRRILAAAGLLALPLHAAQPPADPHASHGASQPPAANSAAPPAPPRPNGKTYRSAFADYRPFDPEISPKGWREANDEVKAAGGHAGLMSHGKAKEHGK